jgi:glycosyltransferase involved in cell wall biosynthesis
LAKIVFYCNDSRDNLDTFEYYKQDTDALKALGHEVVICTRYREIPRDFDLMFVWWWTFALYPVLLARLLRRPVIVTGTYNFRFPKGFEGVDYFVRPAWQQALIRWATKLATLNLFVNTGELRGCTEYFGIRSGRYMPHVIADDYLKGPGPQRSLTLFNLAWSGKKNLVRKGIPELLQAVAIVKKEFPDIMLRMAGHEGDGAAFLKESIASLNIKDNVEWLGPVSREDKISLLRECEIYVQPSHYEGFGLAMAEAMGCGACVITCDVGAVRDVVGDCGIYVTPGSPEELAAALTSLLNDPARRRDLQQRAQRRASVEFAFSSKLVRLAGFLREAGIA